MRRYPFKTPVFLPWLQPKDLVWKMPKTEAIYLTFDDGPQPEITPRVLDLLAQYGAKATFFCVGENAARYPELVRRIQEEGHTLGNHTFRHLKGWKTDTQTYVADVLKAAQHIDSGWFRPPYGRIKTRQVKALQKWGFRIVMWEVLCGDFDPALTADECMQAILKNARGGSIVVLHDSVKAAERCLPALENVLRHYHHQNTPLKALPPVATFAPLPAL